LKISFSPRAETDLEGIFAYLSLNDIEAARRIILRILQSIAILEHFPLIGRVGRVANTRELTVARLPYYAVYHFVDETEIEVIAVIHDRQRFPPSS
jgi:toxin ParE1/3/4